MLPISPYSNPNLTGKAWLDDHLTRFVAPELGKMPDPNGPLIKIKAVSDQLLRHLQGEPVPAHLVKTWNKAKECAAGKTILLPGRDTWLFEVVARLEGWDTIFRPDISSDTWSYLAKNDPDRERWTQCYGLDSGIAGSVPIGLKCKNWGVVISTNYNGSHQVFPGVRGSIANDVYDVLEGFVKYWTHGKRQIPPIDSKITGIHQEIESASTCVYRSGKVVGNLRFFEIAAVGTMLLADYWLGTQTSIPTTRAERIEATVKKIKARRRVA